MTKVFTIAFMFICISAQSQYFNKKSYEKTRNLPVYFVVPKSNDAQVKEDYIKLIETYWTDKNYKVVTAEEVKTAIKRKEDIITGEFQECQYQSSGLGKYGATANRFVLDYKGNTIFSTFIEDEISQVDIIYALKQAQFAFKNGSKFSKTIFWTESPKYFGKQLKEKTLLLPKECASKMTLDEIKKVYPYKFEIVEDDVIVEKALSCSNDYLTINFGNYLWSDGKTSSFKIVYSLSDGAIVSSSMAKFSIGSFSASHILKEKDFKNFLEESQP